MRLVLANRSVQVYVNPQHPDALRPGGVRAAALLNVSAREGVPPPPARAGRVTVAAVGGQGYGEDRLGYLGLLPLRVL